MTELTIPHRFNGPPDSGNGGYSCALLARHVAGPARVRLHSPPPLDTPLKISVGEAGEVSLNHGDTLLGTGRPTELDLDVPPAPTLAQAQRGRQAFAHYHDHVLPTCFVCGTARAEDGLSLHPGPFDDSGVLACDWQPAADLLDVAGQVPAEITWSALDCPGCFAALGGAQLPVLLGELEAEIYADIPGEQSLVVYAWPIGHEGRKYYGGTAIANGAGEVLAASRSTWIVLKASHLGG